MKIKIVVVASIFILFGVGLFLGLRLSNKTTILSPLGKPIKEKPLDKYTFENLKKRKFLPSSVLIGKMLKDGEGYKSYLFFFKDQEKKVSGLLNIPQKSGTYPLIVMFRGYVDKEKYTTGEGTRRAGEYFAQNGFITLAPDFLGYGESDKPSKNSIEERFQTYTTALTLLNSLDNLSSAFDNFDIKADTRKVGIWGHSNGGHIALSVLAISGRAYPTVLWNPVSKPFPYSIIYYTDEFDDHGKALRKAVSDFEKDYDVEKYSPTNFLNWINSPLRIYQGASDESVPKKWSDQLVENLRKLKKNVSYFVYLNEDHNFSRGSWQTIVLQNISFYLSNPGL